MARRWRSALHPRRRDGKFAKKAGGSRRQRKYTKKAARQAGVVNSKKAKYLSVNYIQETQGGPVRPIRKSEYKEALGYSGLAALSGNPQAIAYERAKVKQAKYRAKAKGQKYRSQRVRVY